MDLFFANLVTIVFFITGYKLIEKAIFPMPSTLLKIALYSLLIFCYLGITSILFAIAIGLWLPDTYPVTFSYKALFMQKDSIIHTNFMLAYPEECKLTGSPRSSYTKICKFKLAEGVYFEAPEVHRFNKEGYCIAQLFKNGVFIHFVLQPHKLCV